MQGDVGPLGDKPVGLDHQPNIGRLHRDNHIIEPELLADADMPHGAFEQCFGGRVTVFFQDIFFERSGIHTDPNRYALLLRGSQHLADPIL